MTDRHQRPIVGVLDEAARLDDTVDRVQAEAPVIVASTVKASMILPRIVRKNCRESQDGCHNFRAEWTEIDFSAGAPFNRYRLADYAVSRYGSSIVAIGCAVTDWVCAGERVMARSSTP